MPINYPEWLFKQTRIFHMTAIDNLPNIFASGGLLAKNMLSRNCINYTNVAYEGIQDVRHRITLPNGNNLHDYVPFHFAPRSPMLFAIADGIIANCTTKQEDMIYFVSYAEQFTNNNFVFCDHHPIMQPHPRDTPPRSGGRGARLRGREAIGAHAGALTSCHASTYSGQSPGSKAADVSAGSVHSGLSQTWNTANRSHRPRRSVTPRTSSQRSPTWSRKTSPTVGSGSASRGASGRAGASITPPRSPRSGTARQASRPPRRGSRTGRARTGSRTRGSRSRTRRCGPSPGGRGRRCGSRRGR